MTKQTSRYILSSLVILTLVLVPVLQTAPSNLLHPQTASATGGIILNGTKTTSATVLSPLSSTTISSFNVGTGSNRVLIVSVESSDASVSSITFGGTALTKKVSSFTNNDAEFWYLINPSGTHDIVVTMSAPTKVVIGAYSFFGVDQTTPLPTSAANHNTVASSPTISITTANSNSWVLDSAAIYGAATLSSPTCTQRWDINLSGLEPPHNITGASSSTNPASAGSVTCSWTASSGELWDDVAIEVKASTATSTGILVPLYCDPYGTDDSPCPGTGTFRWQSVNDTKTNHHNVPLYFIINPKSGFQISNPAICQDSVKNVADYAKGAANLTKSGVVVLGYISTNYTQQSQATVRSQIDNYKNCIPSVKGIFFDEMSNDNSVTHENYYSNLTSYAKGTDGMTYTVGNPGTSTIAGYVGTVDNMVIYENTGMPSNLSADVISGDDKNNFSFLSYDVSSMPSSSTISADASYVGFMYVTDNTGCNGSQPPCADLNPWNTTSTYIGTLAADLDQ